MKRIIAAAVIAAIMAGSLLGCGAGQEEQTEAAQEETTQAQPTVGQEETTQAQEAESGGVRPIYKLQGHSRMEEQDLTLIKPLKQRMT